MDTTRLELDQRATEALAAKGIASQEALMDAPVRTIHGLKSVGENTLSDILAYRRKLITLRDFGETLRDDTIYADAVASYGGYARSGTFFFFDGYKFKNNIATSLVFRDEDNLKQKMEEFHLTRINEVLDAPYQEMRKMLGDEDFGCRRTLYEGGAFFPIGFEDLTEMAYEIAYALVEQGFLPKDSCKWYAAEITREFSELSLRAKALKDIHIDIRYKPDFENKLKTLGAGICPRIPSNIFLAGISSVPDVVLPESAFSFSLPTLEAFVDSINDERKKTIMRQRLSGMVYMDIGLAHGISRERIRQIMDDIISKKPPLVEDIKYKEIFETYKLSWNEFHAIFPEEAESVYCYLGIMYVAGSESLYAMLKAGVLDTEHTNNLRRFLSENDTMIFIDGNPISRNSIDAFTYIIKSRFGSEPVTSYVLYDTVITVLEENDITLPIRQMSYKRFRQKLILAHNVILHSCEEVRYLEISEESANDIIGKLPFEKHMNAKISAQLLWDECQSLMEKHDIRNGWELFSILKVHENSLPEYINLIRNPNLDIGETDFRRQVEECAAELDDLSAATLSKALNRKYGLLAQSMASNPTVIDVFRKAK